MLMVGEVLVEKNSEFLKSLMTFQKFFELELGFKLSTKSLKLWFSSF